MWIMPSDIITPALCGIHGDDPPSPCSKMLGSLLTDTSGPFLSVVAEVQPQPLWARSSAHLVVGSSLPCPDHGASTVELGAHETAHSYGVEPCPGGVSELPWGREGEASGQESGPTTLPTRATLLFPTSCQIPHAISLEERVLKIK